ncbi:MAG: Ku protein [Firmicutes bacterium]|nr:Ku protein [Bacillota bacterium]
MHPLWKGAISFGLVNVPVKLYPATENRDLKFNYLHKECQTPLQYRKYCPYCNREVPPEEVTRGYEYEKGKYVIIRDEDLESIPLEKDRNINIIDFVNLKEIDPIYFEKSYYVIPGDRGQKAYALLKKAMEETRKIAIARIIIRTKASLAALRVRGLTLIMSTMFYPEEIRSVAELPEVNFEGQLHENEIKMAVTLVNNLAVKFEPEKYTDEYRQALLKVIEAKIQGEEVTTPVRPETGKVVDLMEALKASIELAKQTKERTSPTGEKAAPPRRQRKSS